MNWVSTPPPVTFVIDDERFTAVADPEQPGAWHLTWETSPNPAYGFITRLLVRYSTLAIAMPRWARETSAGRYRAR